MKNSSRSSTKKPKSTLRDSDIWSTLTFKGYLNEVCGCGHIRFRHSNHTGPCNYLAGESHECNCLQFREDR